MRSRCRSLLLSIAWFALIGLGPHPAWANGIELPELDLLMGVADNPGAQMQLTEAQIQGQIDQGNMTVVENPDGSLTLSGGTFTMAGMWEASIDTLTLDTDPFVNFVGGFKNLAGGAMDFILSTTLAVAPVLPSSLIGGSSTLTYGDANFDGFGGLTNAAGGAGFSGTIDGGNALDMLVAFSLTPDFEGQTKGVSETQGLPGPTIPDAAVATDIGIVHRFNLSSLDQVTYNSTFIVIPVPEPSTGLLLGLGIAGLALVRRQR
jgi:hypothetical protein